MSKKIIPLLVEIGIILTILTPYTHFARGQSPQYELYLPIVLKDRGQTVFGVEVNWFNTLLADRAKDSNVTWVRMNGLIWSDIQPSGPNEYQWQNVAAFENYLINAAQRKLNVILIVRSTPSWAQKVPGSYCSPIKQQNLGNFAQFMYEVVKRYSAYPYNVLYYELWNEPDVAPNLVPLDSVFGCWGDNNDSNYGGGYYAEMLKTVYPVVKSANPNARIVVGGLLLDCDPRGVGSGYCPNETARKPPRFIQGILQNNGANYFDYISFHGYPSYNSAQSPIQTEKGFATWQANGGVVAGKIDYLRSLTNKPLLHTEGGLLYQGTPTEAFQQAKADYVVWLYARNWALDIQGTTWYTLNGPGWRNGGLLDANQNPLPAYNALKYMTLTLWDYQYNQQISPDSDTFGFEFVKGTSRIWIVFSPDNNPRTINVPSGFTSAYDPLGNSVTPSGGLLTITRPTYIHLP